MSKKLKWVIIILVVLVILLIVLSKAGAFGKDEGTRVSAEKVAKRTIIETVTASGKVYPEVEVKVSSDISGEVVELKVNEGDTVKKGQVLAKIYADIYASQRDQAAAQVSQSQAQAANANAQLGALKASLDQTEAAYNRQKTLLDQKVISRSEFETAQQAYFSAKANYVASQQTIRANMAGVASAQASLNRADKDVSRTTIMAPMDGVVSLMEVKRGERVVGTAQMTGTEMMRIADLNSIEVQVDVAEGDIPKVKLGDSAIVEIDAFNNRKFKGVVYKIANPLTLANSATATTSSTTTVTNYQVHIRLLPDSYRDLIVKNQPFPFRPNMTASADIQTSTHRDVLSVPLNAVTIRDPGADKKDPTKKDDNTVNKPASASADDDMQEVVFVYQADGKVKKVQVKTDIQDINNIEIKSGIKEGDQVITGPYDVVSKQLQDGAKVKIVPKEQLVQSLKK
ncbi:efflux RND transporter periplasmic adaptor subunit [Deminuibacter soli]|uniref:HlyD family efflux transporter periplasmic adaptor subunit n=1 Tax=Deminuibacter soli TaxID=2291815 RepID=A0A3E1NFF4_9BACT|nr:efflux RND transporter periplasmic adaptor subunit [Deminuibacter soli]RFM26602.1 HlyD family efflux transporter periplasmic adaptor subunit [Deminuibacter soli]